MKLRNIRIIISREYLTRVKKKSFLLTTFLVPVLFAAVCILPSVIMMLAKEEQKNVAVVDQSNIVMPYLVDSELIDYTEYASTPIDSLKANFSTLGLDALLVISPVDTTTRSVSVSSYSESPISLDVKETLVSCINEAVEDYRLTFYDTADLKQIMAEIESDISISTYTLDESGEEKITSSEVYPIVSMVLSIIIYMFIAMFSGMVMQSVIEEKSSRIVEVLVSSVKATELMFGKIIGVACVALTQFLLWILLTLLLVTGFSAFVGFDSLVGDPAKTEQMMQMAQMPGQSADLSVENVMSMTQNESELNAVFATLADLDYTQLLIAFVIYFALGYLLYASFFAAIGSAVDNEADTNQLQMPVTIPLMIAFFIALYAFRAPDSQIVFWGSMIPFTSPIVMLARIPYGVPTGELVLSMAILVATFIASAWMSAKIYKIGILMFGKKTTFKDLWKWLKMK
jgi:ABC-2 type transport system permease protein